MIKKYFFPLLFLILFIIAINPEVFETSTLRAWYSISLWMRVLLQGLAPFLMICLMGSQILNSPARLWKTLALIGPIIFACNFFLINAPYALVKYISPPVSSLDFPASPLTPLIDLNFYFPFTTQHALMLCAALAVISPFILPRINEVIASALSKIGAVLINLICYFILPLLLIGSVMKLQADHLLPTLCSEAFHSYLVSLQYAFGWIVFLWIVACRGSFTLMFSMWEKLTWVVGIAFTSMSSLVALPFLLKELRPSLRNPDNASLVLPILSNVHSAGSAIITGSTVLLLFELFGVPYPSVQEYLTFGLLFAIFKFTNVALPGGVVLLISPLLESRLGFTPEMTTFLLIIDLMSDSIITVLNVMANGAMMMIIDRIYGRVFET